jgi:hypothetical protein
MNSAPIVLKSEQSFLSCTTDTMMKSMHSHSASGAFPNNLIADDGFEVIEKTECEIKEDDFNIIEKTECDIRDDYGVIEGAEVREQSVSFPITYHTCKAHNSTGSKSRRCGQVALPPFGRPSHRKRHMHFDVELYHLPQNGNGN